MASNEKDLSDRVARLESITRLLKPTASAYMGSCLGYGGFEYEDIGSAFYRLEAKLTRLEQFLNIQEVTTPAKTEYVKLDKK